jgi:hypothetical protein
VGLNRDEWDAISNRYRDIYVKKNEEYGDADLHIMGRALQLALGLETESDGIESAIVFYLLGKVARVISANQRGERASDDTILDITIYSMMLSGVRHSKPASGEKS